MLRTTPRCHAITLLWLLSTCGAWGNIAMAATVWTGPTVAFSKPAFADFNLPQNQDRLTDDVWITRKNTEGLFNIQSETGYSMLRGSPVDTEWAFGTTADFGSLSYLDWTSWHAQNPPSTVNRDAVLHLISEDIFLDIRFTAWGQGAGAGGSYSYVRSTPPPPMLDGDTNGDGLINIDDLNNVRNNFGAMGDSDGTLSGDAFPFDGLVNIDDLNAVRNNFGAGAAVPEPGAFCLALLVGLGPMIAQGRRRAGK